MALIRSGLTTTEWQNYELGDYEAQKKAFLVGIAEEAEQILKTARQKAGDILKEAHAKGIQQAEAELTRKKDEGFRKGYEEGQTKGKAEALAFQKDKIEKELVPLVADLRQLLDTFDKKSQALFKGAENTLVKASLDLARHVIEIESTLNEDVLKARLTKSLNFLRPGLDLKLRLPLGGRAILEPLLQRLLDEEGLQTKVEWSEDENISAGSLVVSSGDSVVQFDSQLQWRALLEKLKLKAEN